MHCQNIITTIAGSTTSTGFSGDNGQATSAKLNYPEALSLDASGTKSKKQQTRINALIVFLPFIGNVYITDTYNHRIRKVTTSTGIVTTIVGTGTTAFGGDGSSATSATVYYPDGITVDSSNNVYISDYGNNRIRKVTIVTGIITTIAGIGSTSYAGDGGAATSAAIGHPYGVALDSSGNVYIADQSNHRIRKVTVSTYIMSTIAGKSAIAFSGDGGAATSASLNTPLGVTVDSSGNVYFADF